MLYKLGSWHSVVKQQRNTKDPDCVPYASFILKGKRICQNRLLLSRSGRRFDAERQIIMEEKDRQ
jgi:hypothetical protein